MGGDGFMRAYKIIVFGLLYYVYPSFEYKNTILLIMLRKVFKLTLFLTKKLMLTSCVTSKVEE